MIKLSKIPRPLAGAIGLALICATALPSAAGATTATATLTAGSLGLVSAPSNPAFPSTALTGLNQSITATQTIDVGDATGSGVGWNLTATSTTFTAGANTLPTSSVTIASAPASPTCDSNATCSPATAAAGVTYPYSLPAGTTAPTATKMYSAAAGTGLGDQTLSPTWPLAVPAKALAGSYTSTWTLSLVSGP